ncbi:PIN domain-containing protein [Geoglobus ahangari]
MEVVVDTNVIISALLRDGLTRRLILLAPFEMYTVPFVRLEIEKHRKELLSRAKIESDAFELLMDAIFSRIKIVDPEFIEPFRKKAIEILRDVDIYDAPFLALAMALNCPIWSNDGDLKKQSVVRVYTTREIVELLEP